MSDPTTDASMQDTEDHKPTGERDEPAGGPAETGAPIAEPKPERAPNPNPRTFVVQPAIGNTPGYIWVQNDEGDLGRVFLVKMRFGKEIERIRLTKQFKKLSAKQVRDEVGPVVGDLLFNEREHGALSEEKARQVIERAMGPVSRRPGPRPAPRPGQSAGPGPRPGGASRAPRGGARPGGPNGPRPGGSSRPPRPR